MTFNLMQGALSVMVAIKKEHLTSLLRARIIVQTYFLSLVSRVTCISGEAFIIFLTNLQEEKKKPTIISSVNEENFYLIVRGEKSHSHM